MPLLCRLWPVHPSAAPALSSQPCTHTEVLNSSLWVNSPVKEMTKTDPPGSAECICSCLNVWPPNFSQTLWYIAFTVWAVVSLVLCCWVRHQQSRPVEAAAKNIVTYQIKVAVSCCSDNTDAIQWMILISKRNYLYKPHQIQSVNASWQFSCLISLWLRSLTFPGPNALMVSVLANYSTTKLLRLEGQTWNWKKTMLIETKLLCFTLITKIFGASITYF